jgi:ribose transport system ATP-binding protein
MRSPLEARRHGVSIVFQELNLFPHRTVTANVFANREIRSPAGVLRKRAMRESTRQTLTAMGLTISPDAMVGDLSLGEKQLVEIARTLQQQSEIVILDEPNSALTERESERLFAILREQRDKGLTSIYVSHRLEEVFSIADRISVIRDGQYHGTYVTSETSIPEIVTAMIGRKLEESAPTNASATFGKTMLTVRELRREPNLGPVSFEVRAGEILGFAGLEGAGVDELFRVLFGLERMQSGEIIYNDKPQVNRNPLQAIKHGWGLIPASRREQGLMMEWSIRENATLLVLNSLLNKLGLIDTAATRKSTEANIRRLNVATDSIDKNVVNLSGGNQQKVLLAKWLATGPKILLLNDPTRGVDVGAKAEICALCRELAEQGLAILFTSSEIEETLGLCNRLLVFGKGKVVREFSGGATKADVMHAMSGWSEGSGPQAASQQD